MALLLHFYCTMPMKPYAQDWLCSYLSDLPDTDECVSWPFAKRSKGHGAVRWNGRQVGVPRIVWERATGAALGPLEACHSCDNPSCINPRHLFAGSKRDNAIDAAKKDRKRRKLCIEDVRLIRTLANHLQPKEIAPLFGVHRNAVTRILRGERRQHV